MPGGRPPSVDPQLIYEVLTQVVPKPGAQEVADILTKALKPEKPFSRYLVYRAIKAHGWDLDPAPLEATAAPRYQVERDLGPIRGEHKGSHHWLKLTTYERVQLWRDCKEGGTNPEGAFAKQAVAYVTTRLIEGTVTDYHPDSGWAVRVAWPWELGFYYRQCRPEDPRAVTAELLSVLADVNPAVRLTEGNRLVRLSHDHVLAWRRLLDSALD